jgi:hypothetical protein
MRNFPTRGLITCGLVLLLVWFVYASFFAGIPYQDPTPEMSANYAFHSSVSNAILVIGLGALFVGMVGGVARLLLKKLGKMQKPPK